MSQIENIPQNDANLGTIAVEGIQGLQTQLRAALRRVAGDDLSMRFINNAIDSAETLLADLVIEYNRDSEEFNQLSAQLDDKDTAVKLAHRQIEEMQRSMAGASNEVREEFEKQLFDAGEKVRVLEREKLDLAGRVADMEIALKTTRTSEQTIRRELKRLQDMEPEKKIEQLANYKKETHELRAKVRELGSELTREQRERIRLSTEGQTMAQALGELRNHNLLLANDVKKINGASQYDWDFDNHAGEPRRFWLHRYAYGISNKPGMNNGIPKMLYGVNFSYVIFSCRGYGINVLPNEWMAPSYNPFEEFEVDKPSDIEQVMTSIFESELENVYPQMIKRAIWARTVSLADVPDMPKKALKLFEGTHYKTLYDVVSQSPLRLLLIKGIGKELAGTIGKVCLYEVSRWMDINGDIEDISVKM